MSLPAVFVFAAVLGMACAMPGPTVLALATRSASRGSEAVLPMIPGLVLGEIVWMSCAAFGAAGLASSHVTAVASLKYLSAAYLAFLAWRSWKALPVGQTPFGGGERNVVVSAGSGLALSLGNPKTMLFYVAILPMVIDLGRISMIDIIILAVVVALVSGGIFLAYVFGAGRLQRAMRSPVTRRRFQHGASVSMLAAAAFLAVR